MLPTNVTANLDYLASLGVLDYDAAADIAGVKPRYYGSPKHYVDPVVMTPLDSFTPSSSSANFNPFKAAPTSGASVGSSIGAWVGFLVKAAIGLTGLYFGGKLFLKAGKGIKSFSLKNLFSRSKKTVKKAASNVRTGAQNIMPKRKKNVISNAWSKFTGIFSRNKSRIRLT